MRGFVLPIPEPFQTSFHLHMCPPESQELTATSSLHGAYTPYYSVSRGHARGTSRGSNLSTQPLDSSAFFRATRTIWQDTLGEDSLPEQARRNEATLMLELSTGSAEEPT